MFLKSIECYPHNLSSLSQLMTSKITNLGFSVFKEGLTPVSSRQGNNNHILTRLHTQSAYKNSNCYSLFSCAHSAINCQRQN